MSLRLSDEEIEKLLSGEEGGQPNEHAQLLRGLVTELLSELSKARQDIATAKQPATPPPPAAPAALTVPAKKKDPAVWNCHVVERDPDKRIKMIRFEEWVKPS